MSLSKSNTKLTYLEFIGCTGKTAPRNHWEDENNHKKYMEYLSYKLGYTKTEHWYGITKKSIKDNYGGGLLYRFNNSPYKLIKSVFPENEWLVWMFKCAPNVWKNAAIRKEYVLWLGERLGYNNKDDWYGITATAIKDNYGGGLLDSFDDSPHKLLESVFPDYKLLVWLFIRAPQGIWKKADIRKEYVLWLGERLGYNTMEDWYGITARVIKDNYGCGLLYCFDDSPYQLITDVFPEYKWLVWMFKCAPHVWENADIRKEYLEWLGKRLGFNNIEDWYGITTNAINDNYGSGLLGRFNNSPYKLIKDVFPEYKWFVWMFNVTPKGMWENAAIRKQYIEWLGKRLGFNTMEDWYGITTNVINDNYGGGLLGRFNGSPYKLIKDVFPEYKWLVWMFKHTPNNEWTDSGIRKDYVLWLGEILGYNNNEDWYGISVKAINDNYGCGLLKNYYSGSPYQIIKDVFPEYKWVKSKFCNLKTEKKMVDYLHKNKERLNIDCIKHGYRPSWADVRATDNTYYIYDIYIKLINGVESIIEIDGRQHYVQVSNWNSPESTQIRDRKKEDLAVYNNHNLLRVNQDDVLSDKGDWDEIVDEFIKEVYESEGVLIIDDCAGGERYSEI